MKFFGREQEIKQLQQIRKQSHDTAKFTVITGRRRVGKTALVRKALNDGKEPFIYLLITRQNERTLCRSLRADLAAAGVEVSEETHRFVDLFKAIAKVAESRPLTVVIDEFQDLDRINTKIFTELKSVWEEGLGKAKLNLVVCGSVNRLMKKVFFAPNAKLGKRALVKIEVKPFKPDILKKIFTAYKRKYKLVDLWSLWTLTGGVARYVEYLMEAGAFDRKAMVEAFLDPNSPLIDEGRNILSEEFGTEYATFFSILAEVSGGKKTFGELSSTVGSDVGTYLARLETEHGLIRRTIPCWDPPKSRNTRYVIDDCFIRFWFKFVFQYRSWIEMERWDELKKLVLKEFDSFGALALEQYFTWKFAFTPNVTCLGGWWDRKGLNEIELVCEDEKENKFDLIEVKPDAHDLNADVLRTKCEALFLKFPEQRSRLRKLTGLSVADL